MTNPPLTPEERLARLEGVYEHLATKADVVRLEGQIKAESTRLEGAMAELKTELHKGLNRNLYITIGAVVAVATLMKYLP
ncbi:MAG: hypothetical protein OXE49_15360 [Gemmatimonadetes bacterium]|nr:hypothetical protein [Gemmatimonadota bacterium]